MSEKPIIVHLRRTLETTYCGRYYRRPDGRLKFASADPSEVDLEAQSDTIRACVWCQRIYESDVRR